MGLFDKFKKKREAPWTYQGSGTDRDLEGMHFRDNDRGWIVGQRGTILVTENGGMNWTSRPNRVLWQNLNAVSFPDEKHGWVAGKLGAISLTADGGLNWEQLTSPMEEEVTDLEMLDLQHGLACGAGGHVWRTEDGRSWVVLQTGSGKHLRALSMMDAKNAWACGDSGTLLKTGDGGKTWEDVRAPDLEHFTDIQFKDPLTGWIVSNQQIFRTTSGGTYWQAWKNQFYEDTIRGIWMLDKQNGWAVGGTSAENTSLFLQTLDGGATWERFLMKGMGFAFLNRVQFTEPEHGWACGHGGAIVHFVPVVV
jgi:photosystem II stability/assembly factor-like uncharacterized protein